VPYLETLIGAAAAFCTTVSYIPQLRKCWTTGETDDLSLKMLLLLGAGLSLWMLYGFMRGDIVIIIANGVSLIPGSLSFYPSSRPEGSRKSASPAEPGSTASSVPAADPGQSRLRLGFRDDGWVHWLAGISCDALSRL